MKKTIAFILSNIAMCCFAQIEPPEPSEPDGMIGGYEFVDLGLPSGTLWATYNVGASSPYEKGLYFAWGEIEPRENFTWETYDFYLDQESAFIYKLKDIGNDIYGTEYDAASHIWGNGWRMPNEQERYELQMMCWNKWKEENGVWGVRIYGPNEHSIFLPVCGYGKWYGHDSFNSSVEGGYWVGCDNPQVDSNGEYILPSNQAKFLLVDSSGLNSGPGASKARGKNIRAVINPKETGIQQIGGDRNINLYYNNGSITVCGSSDAYKLNVVGISGQIVYSTVVRGQTFDVPFLAKGVYLIYVTNGKGAISIKKITVK